MNSEIPTESPPATAAGACRTPANIRAFRRAKRRNTKRTDGIGDWNTKGERRSGEGLAFTQPVFNDKGKERVNNECIFFTAVRQPAAEG
jgi:hypothetical protein